MKEGKSTYVSEITYHVSFDQVFIKEGGRRIRPRFFTPMKGCLSYSYSQTIKYI